MSFEEKTLEKFNVFFNNLRMASTYQVVFLKSLSYIAGYKNSKLDWGKDWLHADGDKLFVDLDFIAVPYTKYYWDMFFKFRLKQSSSKNQFYTCIDCNKRQEIIKFTKESSTCKYCNSKNLENKDQDINIHRNFIGEDDVPIEPYKHLEDIAKDDKLIKNVIHGNKELGLRSSFTEPLYALNEKGFYKPRQKGTRKTVPLELDFRMIDFFKKFKTLLENSFNYKLTRYLESINKSPKIAEKILLNPKRPKLKREEEKQMWKFNPNGSERCFYCNKPKPSFAIDHVVPFDYVLDTDLYNSVPACKTCNSQKSNKLPDYNTHFADVLERNKQMNLEFYLQENFEKLYNDCLVEYHGSRKFFKKNPANPD